MSLPRFVAAPTLPAPTLLIALLALLVPSGAGLSAQGTASGESATTTISGSVYDSLAARDRPGAVVQLVSTAPSARVWSAITGADGEFELSGVPRGKYLVGFLHLSLDSLGLGIPARTLVVGDSAAMRVDLAVPSGATIRKQLCSDPAANDSTGLVLGFIRDADTGAPLGGATMVVMWTEVVLQNGVHTDRREIPVESNDRGWFALCGVPSEGAITARAELGEDASGYIEITVPPRGLLHRDFSIPRGAAAIAVIDTINGVPGEQLRHGSARLTGVVRNGKGKPLAGAQLMLWGSGITGSTSDDGTFALSNLPAGTHTLEARYLGYAPGRIAVELSSNQTRSVAVTLDQRADVLSGTIIYGKETRRSRDLTGFLERRNRGFGHFFTQADIEKRHAFRFTDLMRMVPGFRLVPAGGFGYSIISTRGSTMSGGCRPQIFLDGVHLLDDEDLDLLVQPSDIVGVEAYAGPSGSPPQYTSGACASILIWTGPNLGDAKS